jgi:ketosteroid isomerase-like protein
MDLQPFHAKDWGIAMNRSSRQQVGFVHHAVAGSRRNTRRLWAPWLLGSVALGTLPLGISAAAGNSAAADQKIVSALDKDYQKAVEQNDAPTMARILADDFVLVVGNGKAYTKTDLVDDAKSGKTHYVHQEDSDQTVRVWGDTAVVTAKLWAKGIEDGKAVDYTVWFSDTYVRTPKGWSYVFGMASLPLPKEPRK